MTAVLIIAACTLTAAGARLVAGRLYHLPKVTTLTRVILMAVAVVGAGLVVVQSGSLRSGLEEKSWPTATGTVVASRIEGERSYRPLVVYAVEDKTPRL